MDPTRWTTDWYMANVRNRAVPLVVVGSRVKRVGEEGDG